MDTANENLIGIVNLAVAAVMFALPVVLNGIYA